MDLKLIQLMIARLLSSDCTSSYEEPESPHGPEIESDCDSQTSENMANHSTTSGGSNSRARLPRMVNAALNYLAHDGREFLRD